MNTNKYVWTVTYEAELTPENAELFNERITKDAKSFVRIGNYISKQKMEAKVRVSGVPVGAGA